MNDNRDIWSLIFSFLDIHDLNKCRLLSKDFKATTSEAYILRSEKVIYLKCSSLCNVIKHIYPKVHILDGLVIRGVDEMPRNLSHFKVEFMAPFEYNDEDERMRDHSYTWICSWLDIYMKRNEDFLRNRDYKISLLTNVQCHIKRIPKIVEKEDTGYLGRVKKFLNVYFPVEDDPWKNIEYEPLAFVIITPLKLKCNLFYQTYPWKSSLIKNVEKVSLRGTSFSDRRALSAFLPSMPEQTGSVYYKKLLSVLCNDKKLLSALCNLKEVKVYPDTDNSNRDFKDKINGRDISIKIDASIDGSQLQMEDKIQLSRNIKGNKYVFFKSPNISLSSSSSSSKDVDMPKNLPRGWPSSCSKGWPSPYSSHSSSR